MNHFLALVPDAATRDRLAAIAERLRAWELPARWVHPDDYHLTLAFLGRLDATEAALIPAAVDDLFAAARPPRLALPGLGALGGAIVPRVVYAAVADPHGEAGDLEADLTLALGLDGRRPFRPHITLCRPTAAPADTARNWPELLAGHGQADWGTCNCTTISLLHTVAAPPGRPRYRTLATWPF
jgi:2'-5' RNA ligase